MNSSAWWHSSWASPRSCFSSTWCGALSRADKPVATRGGPRRWSGKPPIFRRGMATGARRCRWSIAGRTTIACQAPPRTSCRRTCRRIRWPSTTAAVKSFPAPRSSRRNRGNDLKTSQGVGRPGSLDVSFLHQLMGKPWVKGEGSVVALHDWRAFPLPTVTLGLRVFLAVVTVLFSLLVVAYADRMVAADWRSLPVPWLLWLNTVMLILSSVALQWAWGGARWGQIDVVWAGLLAGGGFAIAFLVGQLLAWQQLAAAGYFAATNPAVAFFYLITALHGLHLLGGLLAWGRTTVKVWRGFEVGRVRLSVELCTVYWHFLLLIWLVLFGLLLVT